MRMRNWMMFALTALAVACSGPGGKDGNDGGSGWDLGDRPDGGTRDIGQRDGGGDDAGLPDGGSTDVGRTDAGVTPEPVVFRLTNNTNTPVFAYPNVDGATSCFPDGWLEVSEAGEIHRLASSCEHCSCDEPDCAVCVYDCAPGIQGEAAQLGVGQSREFEWDGLFRVDRLREAGGSCEELRAPREYPLTAEFCWATGFETQSGPFGTLSDIECTTVEFGPDDRVVEAEVQPTPEEPVRFELVNETDELLYAHIEAGQPFCDTGAWVTLAQEGQLIDLGRVCGTCFCSEVEPGGEGICSQPCPAVACAQPNKEAYELPPGGIRAFSWNRIAVRSDTVHEQTCRRRYRIAGEVSARFCWGTDAGDPTIGEPLGVTGEQCETVVFDPYDDDLVRYEIGGAP